MKKKEILKAVALKYDSNKDRAPTITAKGFGSIASKILDLAQKNGVFIHRDSDMVEILSRLEIGDEIPDSLYKAIAEILAFVYKLNKRYRE